jgi:fructan beta-fructosidase
MSEPNRPQFHYTPVKNWMNDPNGLVYFDGEYHLFHQYNPHGDTWGHMSWGHAVSRDLQRWEHLPVALHEEDGVMMFSGSAVVDEKNTSGFGTDGKPPMVAIYTGHTGAKQTQNLAYSTDRGRTWTKYSGNPVIDENLKDFRDPKVLRDEGSRRWLMVVALPDQHKVRFYSSTDLKKWERLGEFGGEGVVDGIWECPDLLQLPVATRDLRDVVPSRDVLVVSVGGGTPAGGGGVQYFIGAFDGKTFRNDNPRELKLFADYGPDFFAAQSFAHLPAAQNRSVWVGWMSNWRYAHAEPTRPWRTAQSLPRELGLLETPAGVRLVQSPARELRQLRGRQLDKSAFATAGQSLEILATLDLTGAAGAVASFSVLGDGEHATVIGYDAARQEMFVDRRNSAGGAPFHKDFPGRYAAPLAAPPGGQVRLHVFVDRTSVEVFSGHGPLFANGLSVITANVFPAASAGRVEVGDGVSLEVWRLKSIWDPND